MKEITNNTIDSDSQYEQCVLKSVTGNKKDGWGMGLDTGFHFWCPSESPIEPKVGMKIRLYGRGFFFPVRGLTLEGTVVFYRTEQQQEEKHKSDMAEHEKKERYDAEKNRAKTFRRYSALPACFQRRIDRFRSNNPDFWWKFESYEMFCCEQAVVIAEALKTSEAINEFHKMAWKEKIKACSKLDDGHSGNTFGCSVHLAYWYLTDEANVIGAHGSLAPLVGSVEYGEVPMDGAK